MYSQQASKVRRRLIIVMVVSQSTLKSHPYMYTHVVSQKKNCLSTLSKTKHPFPKFKEYHYYLRIIYPANVFEDKEEKGVVVSLSTRSKMKHLPPSFAKPNPSIRNFTAFPSPSSSIVCISLPRPVRSLCIGASFVLRKEIEQYVVRLQRRREIESRLVVETE